MGCGTAVVGSITPEAAVQKPSPPRYPSPPQPAGEQFIKHPAQVIRELSNDAKTPVAWAPPPATNAKVGLGGGWGKLRRELQAGDLVPQV